MSAAKPCHADTTESVARRLGVDPARGLSGAEAVARLSRCGANELPDPPARSSLRVFIDQFADFLVLILLGAVVVSALVGDAAETITIVVLVMINAVIGFTQEVRAGRALAALKRLAAPSAVVLRDGAVAEIPVRRLVPGDIVQVTAGAVIPADLRLLEAAQLRLDEAILTGESVPVEKSTQAIDDESVPVADRTNLAYKGTKATAGRGLGVVVETGARTEVGRIASLLATVETAKTPLQIRLARFGRRVGWAVLGVCAVVFATGVFRGEAAGVMFLTAVSLAVAAVPEALPAVVTIALALGARRMAQRNALLRRLPAVEALGSVTVVCSDKTGTLTENRMRVERWAVPGADGHTRVTEDAPPDALIDAAALCIDVAPTADGGLSGDPTEVALYEAAVHAGRDMTALAAAAPRIAELPFDSDRKRMTTFHARDGAVVQFTKGSPEGVIGRCAPFDHESARAVAAALAATGYRVLAFATRRYDAVPAALDESLEEATVERELVFLGLAGLEDPLRPEVPAAVALCRSAGIVPVMITGDHPDTARAIATRAGIAADGAKVITGDELRSWTAAELNRHLGDARVFARVAPEDKVRIVEAYQRRGEIVAMTGDGVNDAPALKRAEIGVAMGVVGTDVAKEASEMVLLDDNFATIEHAVEEGRRIYDNLRKFVRYLMTSNTGEVLTVFVAPLCGLPLPLLPVQILWINLATDGLPGLALSAEPIEDDVMERPPRDPDESLFAGGVWQHIVCVGGLMAAVCVAVQWWAIDAGVAAWQTMVFTSLVFLQLGHAVAVRSERRSVFRQGLFANRAMCGAIALTLVLHLAIVYVPFLNRLFKTQPLTAAELGCCFALGTLAFFAAELEKWLLRQGRLPWGRGAGSSSSV